MTVDLELTVLMRPREGHGRMAGLAVSSELIVGAGGSEGTILASSNARDFEPRNAPRERELHAILATDDALWVCGERGLLAVSRDRAASWSVIDTGTDAALSALALAPGGSIWVVGDHGYVARVSGERVARVELPVRTRLTNVYARADEVAILSADGRIYRWRDGDAIAIATGSNRPLTGLAITKTGTWIVVGEGGFIARSPDGAWFSRVKSGVALALEAIATCTDGHVVCVGDRGLVLSSTDDGRTWRVIETDITAHLWSVARFGAGVLIGGDDGLVLALASGGDDTWRDRINLFGGMQPLDPVFVSGPAGFVVRGLAPYLAALAAEPREATEEVGDDEVEGELSDGAREVLELLGKPGDQRMFEQTFGVPMPAEAAALLAALDAADRATVFEELRIEPVIVPDVGDLNLFELLVRHDQQDYLGTGLVDAFCGVFRLGSLGNGDSYHMELYEWDGPRQVLHYAHDEQVFSGVFADSLDSLVYLASLARAKERRLVSSDAYAIGLRRLRGKVAPTWHFAIEADDPEFVPFDAKRRDTEFLYYRARWIIALLAHDIADVDGIPALFNADFNQVVPHDQLAARFEACERFNPTALYSMWRAYLFDEPEFGRYLDIGRRHKARLVRDASKLIDELRAGRNTLGAIDDVQAHLARFRALDLDPRRADARKAEAEARAKLEASRRQEVEAELDRVPPSGWADLAWRWLDDGIAHRALLRRLDARPDTAAQIAALDALHELSDEERELGVQRIAGELTSELEAILVGSLLRGDALEGVLRLRPVSELPVNAGGAVGPEEPDDSEEPEEDDEDDEVDDDGAPGWDAIDRALEPIYRDAEPHAHYGTALPYAIGGNDPLHGISVYLRDEPVPHFHFVTYGFTDLFDKETDDSDESGFGFELTFRLARAPDDEVVPVWALSFLQNLARYVFVTGNRFAVGHKMGIHGPIALDRETQLTAVLFASDPELDTIDSPLGTAQFVQIVGITDDEYRLIQEWSTSGLVEILQQQIPYLVTDLARDSVLADAGVATEVRRRVDAEGSSEDLSFAGDMQLDVADDGSKIHIELGALYAAALPRAMRGRLRLGRPYTLRGRASELRLVPGEQTGYAVNDDQLELVLPPEVVAELEAQVGEASVGEYRLASWPALELVVTPTLIRDHGGRAVDVRGVADREEVTRLIDEENARLENEEEEEEHEEEEEEEEEEDIDEDEEEVEHSHAHGEHGHDDEDVPPPPPDRVRAALAMTERALRIAPHDDDTQFTHAMLLLDAERAGMPEKIDDLVRALPRYTMSNRLNIVTRLGRRGHPRFAEMLDAVLTEALPARLVGESSTSVDDAEVAAYGDLAEDLLEQLGEAVLAHAPDRMAKLVPLLPDHVVLLTTLAWRALEAGERDHALALYGRLLAQPIPVEGEERTNYLRAMNNACVQAHAAKAYTMAVQIADRAQPVAHENPHLYHSAACAYAAVGEYAKALEQVRHAIEHDYAHLGKVEVDSDLGPLLEWPEFKALFRDWRARQEGN